MNWVEMIQIRISSKDQKLLERELKELILEVNQSTDNILTVYKRFHLDTDVIIHLKHDSSEIEQNGSTLGLRLASALKEYGLVNHSLWEEIE